MNGVTHRIIAAGFQKFKTWLRSPTDTRNRWLGKTTAGVAWFGFLIAIINPPHGTGVTVCWFRASTDLPCIGCGLTRSLSCALRGMFAESWDYHPLGPLILAFFLAVIIASLLPQVWRERLNHQIESRVLQFNLLYVIFVAAFVVFGMVRFVFELSASLHFH